MLTNIPHVDTSVHVEQVWQQFLYQLFIQAYGKMLRMKVAEFPKLALKHGILLNLPI